MTNEIHLLSVVVPVHNEAENILPLIQEIEDALSDFVAFEIVYVNDGSIDDTKKRLGEAKLHHPKLRVLTHAHSCGQSTAVRTGFQFARGDWVVTLDGDGQNDPEDIKKLIAAIESGVV